MPISMERKNQLEKKVKKFDWKEWTPFLGIYMVPRNMLKGEDSQSIKGNMALVNGMYHGALSFLPTIYTVYEIANKIIHIPIHIH